jgi:hypothetical protein
MASARFIPIKSRMKREPIGQQIQHSNARDPRITWIFDFDPKDGTAGPSKYRHAISLPTLETSLSFAAGRKIFPSRVLAANCGLEIRMQFVEITWTPKTDYVE